MTTQAQTDERALGRLEANLQVLDVGLQPAQCSLVCLCLGCHFTLPWLQFLGGLAQPAAEALDRC